MTKIKNPSEKTEFNWWHQSLFLNCQLPINEVEKKTGRSISLLQPKVFQIVNKVTNLDIPGCRILLRCKFLLNRLSGPKFYGKAHINPIFKLIGGVFRRVLFVTGRMWRMLVFSSLSDSACWMNWRNDTKLVEPNYFRRKEFNARVILPTRRERKCFTLVCGRKYRWSHSYLFIFASSEECVL